MTTSEHVDRFVVGMVARRASERRPPTELFVVLVESRVALRYATAAQAANGADASPISRGPRSGHKRRSGEG
jgi:hypothetical protein